MQAPPNRGNLTSKLSELRANREKLADDAEAINAKYPAGTRMPVEEATKLDALLYQIAGVDGEIKDFADSLEAHHPDAIGAVNGAVRVLRTPKEFRAHYRSFGATAQMGSMTSCAASPASGPSRRFTQNYLKTRTPPAGMRFLAC